MRLQHLALLRQWWILVALSAFGASGCAEKAARPGIDPAPEARADSDMNASFAVGPGGDGGARVAIRRDALGKEFLLQSFVTFMPFIGNGNANLSRIVTFKEVDEELWMFEATLGQVVTQDVPQAFVLAKFPVKNEQGGEITFDWNAGMSSLLASAEWRGSDSDGKEVKLDASGVDLKLSYLDSARITPKNQLILRQIAQVENASGQIDPKLNLSLVAEHPTVDIRYYLTPYQPDPAFTPLASPGFKDYGFFEVKPRYDDKGNIVINTTRFGAGPILYAISDNTPADLKDAVRDGILYWNKVFGEERLKVVAAPAGTSAPDFDLNIVQWINWDSAGFAYADVQSDPRTGQALHAQVYLTSVFDVKGRERAKKLLERLPPGGTTVQGRTVGLKGFASQPLCHLDTSADFAHLLSTALAGGADDAAVTRIVQDYIREVVAHEVGHTLGLRHNFAGSLAANFPLSDLDGIYREYLAKGEVVADKIPSSTVMDYQLFMESTLTGRRLVQENAPLPYDKQAIDALYSGKKGEQPQLFCTDSGLETYADCRQFDEGTSPTASLAQAYKAAVRLLAETATAPDGTAVPKVYLDPDAAVEELLKPAKEAVKLVDAKVKLVSVRQRSNLPVTMEKEVHDAELAAVASDLAANGGFAALLPFTFDLPDPVKPEFGAAKAHLAETVLRKLVDALSTAPEKVVDHPVADQFAARLGELAELVALGTTGKTAAVEIPSTPARTVQLPEYTYDVEFRAKAAALLKLGRGASVDFALDQSNAFAAKLVTAANAVLGADIMTIDIGALPPKARRWVLENRVVLGALGR